MYRRFLNNNDYLGIITEEALFQLIRGNEERIIQAEEAAESSLLEYLSDNYEIEKELEVGKRLLEYNSQITYPVGAHFYFEGKPYEAMRSINGVKRPADVEYWGEITDYSDKIISEATQYSQSLNWQPGNIVTFAGAYFQCLYPNGVDFNDIRIPGVNGWRKIEEVPQWLPNVPHNEWDVVTYKGNYYALLSTKRLDLTVNPQDSDNWGLIGEYEEGYEYQLSDTEYVVYNGELYLPTILPTSDELKEGFNIRVFDPRNPNVKKHRKHPT